MYGFSVAMCKQQKGRLCVFTRTYVCMYVCMYVCTSVRVHMCMYVCACIYLDTYVNAYTHTYTQIQNTQARKHINMDTYAS